MGLLWMLMNSPAAAVIHKVAGMRTGSLWGFSKPSASLKPFLLHSAICMSREERLHT